MENRKFGSLSSSVDPAKLSKTIEGILKIVGGLIGYLGYSQITGDINSISDQIGVVITLGVSFFGAVETLFGLLRKVVVYFSQK